MGTCRVRLLCLRHRASAIWQNEPEGIHYEHADLHDEATVQKIIARHKGRVKLLSAFPVCTDLAASGAVWWARKRECDPQFQYTAAEHAMKCVEIAEAIG